MLQPEAEGTNEQKGKQKKKKKKQKQSIREREHVTEQYVSYLILVHVYCCIYFALVLYWCVLLTAGELSLIAEEEEMLQPEAEGTNEEPPIHHDDFINQMDELSDEDEVKHRAHSIICSIK